MINLARIGTSFRRPIVERFVHALNDRQVALPERRGGTKVIVPNELAMGIQSRIVGSQFQ